MTSKLTPGDKAPIFATKDVFGQDIKLKDYKDSYLLLVFLRYSGCPWCNLTIQRLILEQPLLTKNQCKTIAFIQSSTENIQANVYGRQDPKPNFPIIADPEMSIYKDYGVGESKLAAVRSITKLPSWVKATTEHNFKQTKIDGQFFLVPAMILLNKNTQEVIKARYGTSFYDPGAILDIYDSLFFKGK